MILVVVAAGGVGKGTVVKRLMAEDERLWLSRSWTTRRRRPGEASDAYTFVDRDTFLAHAEQGGFLEFVEFTGSGELYGTPLPEVPEGRDLVLEIDAEGAERVRELHPDALVVLLLPPSRVEQERRLRARGDDDSQVARRLAVSEAEEERGRAIADLVVVNDDLDRAVAELASMLDARRRTSPGDPTAHG